eukprot:4745295-Pyramimonas_sp.AAC.1
MISTETPRTRPDHARCESSTSTSAETHHGGKCFTMAYSGCGHTSTTSMNYTPPWTSTPSSARSAGCPRSSRHRSSRHRSRNNSGSWEGATARRHTTEMCRLLAHAIMDAMRHMWIQPRDRNNWGMEGDNAEHCVPLDPCCDV